MNKIKAIVLAGGKASRLGFPKHHLFKDNLPILQWWVNSYLRFGIETYISCNKKQLGIFSQFNCIPDVFNDKGPMESIVCAWNLFPDSSLLISACDLVYIERENIEQLLKNQDLKYDSISFFCHNTKLVFPLFSILNPSAIAIIHNEYYNSKRSLKHALASSQAKLIKVADDLFLKGINTPDELDAWNQQIKDEKHHS